MDQETRFALSVGTHFRLWLLCHWQDRRQLAQRSDVTFYNIATDTWTKLGDFPNALNTLVCDINCKTNTRVHCIVKLDG
jgi:hypothetical protein